MKRKFFFGCVKFPFFHTCFLQHQQRTNAFIFLYVYVYIILWSIFFFYCLCLYRLFFISASLVIPKRLQRGKTTRSQPPLTWDLQWTLTLRPVKFYFHNNNANRLLFPTCQSVAFFYLVLFLYLSSPLLFFSHFLEFINFRLIIWYLSL